ncbi:S1 family peptidase [Tardiphaga robiniae]|uniref:Trypsin-like peptidase domain-containing protein n=1 Tax=Tardiphaga robiniae TaxID=943830 RepID=A0A7G6U6S3_9BRAD|nr:serine protease [Tardiphaga robiniae]QND74705.1 trypsin-like peptidase domain-containing protein [Tardiphaga robiniae]
MWRIAGAVLIMTAIATAEAAPVATQIFELNTILMETTFQVVGPSSKEKGKSSTGTGFVVGKPDKAGAFSYFVLVTAAHVFDDIEGDVATITTREKQTDGSYVVKPKSLFIRDSGKPIFVRHPSLDVAAIYVALPASYGAMKQIGDTLLASEADVSKYEIHAGDELFCLGYPLGASGPYGFPVLRSGKIASFPLTPVKLHPSWIFDFRVFPGNSGGPVYLIDRSRMYNNIINLGETLQMVVGLVTQQLFANDGTSSPRDLQLGVVIPAEFIRETMNLLPADPPESTTK